MKNYSEPGRLTWRRISSMLLVCLFFITGCAGLNTPIASGVAKKGSAPMPTNVEITEKPLDAHKHSIYLAGGCFWGLEKLMRSLPGVLEVTSGYANGNKASTPLVSEAIRNNPGIYPPPDVFAKLFTLKVQEPKIDRVRTRAWTKVKSGK